MFTNLRIFADNLNLKRDYKHKAYQTSMNSCDDYGNETNPYKHIDIRDAVNSKLVKFRKEQLHDVKCVEQGWNNFITHKLYDLKCVTMTDFLTYVSNMQ